MCCWKWPWRLPLPVCKEASLGIGSGVVKVWHIIHHSFISELFLGITAILFPPETFHLLQCKKSSVKEGKKQVFQKLSGQCLNKNLELCSNKAKHHEGKPSLPVPLKGQTLVQFLPLGLLQCCLKILQPTFEILFLWEISHWIYIFWAKLACLGRKSQCDSKRYISRGKGSGLAHHGWFLTTGVLADPLSYFPFVLHTHNLICR